MKQYFTKLHSTNMPKNKLQAAVVDLLKSHSNRLTNDRDALVANIKSAIIHLNKLYNKCQPLPCNIWESSDTAISIGCGDLLTVRFTIEEVIDFWE